MARDLFIDLEDRRFVSALDNSATKIHPPFFKGDTETLNLYFLKKTGVVSAPYEYSNQSAGTLKVSLGIIGGTTLLSVTGATSITTAPYYFSTLAGISSAGITSLLSGTTSAPVTLEVELTTSGNKLTAAQGDANLAVALSH